jgi:anaerobic ribonucleoside-triphosphate reductase activating protein
MNLDDTFLIRGATPPPLAADVVLLGDFQARSVVAGPGTRAVIWVAGCLRRCPGCMKPEWFEFDAGTPVPISELANRVLAISGLDGVTFSGGEPFEQADALAQLCRPLRRAGLNTLAYSGYRLDALRANAAKFGSLLAEVDFLIDGEYRHDLPGPYRWRGSQNQAVYNMRRGERLDAPSECGSREMQLTVCSEGLRFTGFPNAATLRQLAESLERRGVHMAPTREGGAA